MNLLSFLIEISEKILDKVILIAGTRQCVMIGRLVQLQQTPASKGFDALYIIICNHQSLTLKKWYLECEQCMSTFS